MLTESDLARLLGESVPPTRAVDVSSVIRRSSRRRVARRAVVGGATTLAVAGIGVASVTGIRSLTTLGSATSSVAGSSSDSSDAAPLASDGPTTGKRAPAEKLNLCGGALADVAPNADGLVLTTDFDPASANAESVSGSVTMTNTGTERIIGSTAATPAITLSKDGVTLWHSNGAMIAMAAIVDLEPGASMTYQAMFTPVRCAVEDDEAQSFRADLPHLAPGSYQVSAAIDLSRQAADGSFLSNDLVVGPLETVTLR